MRRGAIFLCVVSLLLKANCISAPANTIAGTREVILSVPVGLSEEQFQYKDLEFRIGPDDFYIDEEQIIILDTTGRKLMNFDINGNWTGNIYIKDVKGVPQSIEYQDEYIYVLDNEGTLYTYSTDGKLENKKDISGLSPDGIFCIEKDQNGIYYISNGGEKVWENECVIDEINTIENTSISVSNLEDIENFSDQRTTLYLDVLSDSNGYKYLVTNEVYASDELFSELRVSSLNSDGKIVASIVIDYENWYYYPLNFIKNVNNKIYYMKGNVDCIEIVEVEMRDIIEDGGMKERCAASTEKYDSTDIVLQSTIVATSRTTAFNTAYSYSTYRWTLSSKNLGLVTGTQLPSYIKSLSGSVPATVVGIPYCWGGCKTLSEFRQEIANGYQAGNISTATTALVSNTTGVDCSGFASKVYGLAAYNTTRDFSNGGYLEIAWTGLCKMDFMLARTDKQNGSGKTGISNHIMMFHQRVNSTTLMIIDSSTTTGKVAIRNVNQNNLISNGYTPYRAFSAGHTESSSWSYDANYHYHTCANGCNNGLAYTHYNHSYIVSGNTKTCRVCGYTTGT